MKENSKNPEKLFERINELYHDIYGEFYEYTNPTIEKQWQEKWEKVAVQFFNLNEQKTIIDIGTGTGFVPLAIANHLKNSDKFICSDISEKMLEVSKKRIEKRGFKCKFQFTKINKTLILPFKTSSADIITMNAVLHHINNTNLFLEEIDRVLKPNGLVCIALEPNKNFYINKYLMMRYKIFISLFNIKQFIKDLFKKTFIFDLLQRIYCFTSKKKRDKLNLSLVTRAKLNSSLLKEKLIKSPLSIEEISDLVDSRADEGIEPKAILPKYKREYFRTYDHLFLATTRNNLAKRYVHNLEKKFPEDNSAFFLVLRKPF